MTKRLTIQRDETTFSYVARSLYLSFHNDEALSLSRLCKNLHRKESLLKIAEHLGWHGCEGLNKLLHLHTVYPRFSVLKPNLDISYSSNFYLIKNDYIEISKPLMAICPACVREDISNIGFTYWRRVYSPEIKVCAAHNVLLIRKCPFCAKSFDDKDHNSDVLWAGCNGRFYYEIEPEVNECSKEYLRADFLKNIFYSKKYISVDSVFLALKSRFIDCNKSGDIPLFKYILEEFEYRFSGIINNSSKSIKTYFWFYEDSDLIISYALLLYSGFDDFLADVSRYPYKARAISSLWKTYNSGASKGPNYVTEEYGTGVGLWSCPEPVVEILVDFGEDFGGEFSYIDRSGWHEMSEYLNCCINTPMLDYKNINRFGCVEFPHPHIPIINNGQPLLEW